MSNLSKLQIRAIVLSAISEIKSLQYQTEDALLGLCNKLCDIDDKHALFDIFLKEYVKLDEEDCNFCACLLKEIIPVNYISEKSIETLQSNTISDEYKYKIVQLLRITGGDYNYSKLPEYFDKPEEIIDLETKRLLDSAVFNPESMLDFLDFISAVSAKDRCILLKSLSLDYKGDILANIVYPILYSSFEDEFILQAVDVLSNSKSSLAIAPFEYLIQVSDNPEIVKLCQKGLKLLKLSGASKEKADWYFKNIIKDSSAAQFFVTIPDGSGKQAVLITRKHNNEKYSLASFVISDITGIVDCFGFFNISQEEVIKVINKFYNSEGKYTVPSGYVKSRINFAHNLNIQNKLTYPYEYICWKPMVSDIAPLDIEVNDFIEQNCKMISVSKNDLVMLLTKEYTFRWFIMPDENDFIKKLKDKIYSFINFDIKEINQLLLENINNVFNGESIDIWKNRLYNLIYILYENNKMNEANSFYTILKDEKLFELFKQVILQRSVFNMFVALREQNKDNSFVKNIFRMRNKNEKEFDIKKLDNIINILHRGWIER